MSKVFLSYSHKDQSFVEELYHRLTRDGVDVFYDKESIAWGANFVLELEKGLDECEHIVLVLSPDFCQSEWTKIERTSAMMDDPGGLKRKIRPLLLHECTIPGFLKPIQRIDVSTSDLLEKNYPRICEELGGTVREESRPTDRDKLPPLCRLPARHRMPYRSLGNGFVGRINELWGLYDMLSQGKTAVVQGVGLVVGTGGLGKTQLAIEYVHRFGSYYPGGVFWVDADRGRAIMIEQISAAAGIEIDGKLEEDEQLHQLWVALSQFQPALIVLDNFPANESLQPWLPVSGDIHTLVTTRRRDLVNYENLSLDFLTVPEGMALLNSGQRKFGGEAKALVEALGGLALALELAKHYLNTRPEAKIENLLQKIHQIGEMKALEFFAKQYHDELPSGHGKEVAATFHISWELASPAAKKVLQFISLLAPTAVPRRLIRKIGGLPSDESLSDPIDDAISELATRLSLVELDAENDPRAHWLVSAFVRTMIKHDSIYQQVCDAVVAEMARAGDEKDTASFRELEKVMPHAEKLIPAEFIKTENAIDISNYLGWHNRSLGRYRLAEKFRRQALEISEKHYKPGHPSIATSQSNLALVLRDLGELEEARDLLIQAYNALLHKFGSEHPKTKIVKENLAIVEKELAREKSR